ncbi:MAG: hypothetical protein WA101_00470 [Minisyncoccia bacterium]
MLTFTKKEIVLMNKLNTPAKVQDFLNSLRFNFEESGIQTLKSPIMVLREKNAHCMEGALLGAYILSLHGHKPLILHLKTTKHDFDHIITLFKKDDFWGALSKTNHAVLRYREPVYKNIRELVMSYFHEYFINNGVKTLRQYSKPLDLNIFEKGWETEEEDLWGIDEELDKIKHYDVAPKNILKNLRKAEKIEIDAGKIEEYKSKKHKYKN